MKILYMFEERLSAEESERFLAKISILDSVNYTEETCFFIKNKGNSDSGPKIDFEDKSKQRNFERVFSNEFAIVMQEVLLSTNSKYKTVSPYISSIMSKLITDLIDDLKRAESAN